MPIATKDISIVIPALNEARSLALMLPELSRDFADSEIIVVDDGSSDNTSEICKQNNVICISHAYRKGNGAAIKTGARSASRPYIVFMDADGQHRVADIRRLLEAMSNNYDMVVGAREPDTHASLGRRIANGLYNWFASWMTGHKIADLTSGFRIVERARFLEFLYMLPNTFSYPTTITMAFFRSGYNVGYIPIRAEKRVGTSHISPARDGLRFLIIIFKIGSLFSPLKIFIPISLVFFLLGLANYAYTYWTAERFTNMSVLLFSASVLIFLFGLLSEQITMLMYRH